MYQTEHEIWIENGKVIMANGDDPYYKQVFETPKEIDKFIAELLKAKKECWNK